MKQDQRNRNREKYGSKTERVIDRKKEIEESVKQLQSDRRKETEGKEIERERERTSDRQKDRDRRKKRQIDRQIDRQIE